MNSSGLGEPGASGPEQPDRSTLQAQSGQPAPFEQPDQYSPPSQLPQPGQVPEPGPYPQPDRYLEPGQPLSPQFQQDYAPPAPPYPAAVSPRRTNSLAIAALCCGIGQVVVGPLAGIPAIVLGTMSLKQIRETGEEGRGMATVGLVLGSVGVVLVVVSVLLIAVVFAHVGHPVFPSPPHPGP